MALPRRLVTLLLLAAALPTMLVCSSSAAARTAELGPVKHIAVDGMSMGYRTGGSGFPLIMVIGRSATMAEWDPQLIAQLIGDHEVIVFDNRGVATTDNPSSQTLSIGQMAEDTLALASALQIERFDLMGWSMGGYISQQVALDAPSRVAKLVLCATDAGGSHYVPPSPRVASILTNPEGVTTTQLLALSFPPTRAGTTGAIDYMYDVATQPDLVPESFTIPTATLEGQERAIAGWKAAGGGSYEALPTIKAPTLVAWGNLDRGIRPRNDRIIARRIPDASGIVFKGAGHAFLFQDATQVGGAIDGFLG
ncbi:MAG: alpha/beta hydrolase [Actinobacteria bacterium]|nr:alpha/beta hydrolase [Actinomycetota bacterium]